MENYISYSSYILYKQKSQVLQATVMHFNHLILIFIVSRGSTVKLMCQWLHVLHSFSFFLLSDNKWNGNARNCYKENEFFVSLCTDVLNYIPTRERRYLKGNKGHNIYNKCLRSQGVWTPRSDGVFHRIPG